MKNLAIIKQMCPITVIVCLLLTLYTAQDAWASKRWLSTTRIEKQEVASGSGVRKVNESAKSIAGTVRIFDLVVSLEANPTTDEEKEHYKRILSYFADGMYEQSNGAHKLGDIYVYADGKKSWTCDVIIYDDMSYGAKANRNGYMVPFLKIYSGYEMQPLIEYPLTKEMLAHTGYTLAHEWGHYAYGLADEYQEDQGGGSSPHKNDINDMVSIMNQQTKALHVEFLDLYPDRWNPENWRYDFSHRWLNHSTKWHYERYPESKRQTAQYRTYKASAWETLSRSIWQDPKLNLIKFGLKRIHWPELADVTPTEQDIEIMENGVLFGYYKQTLPSEFETYPEDARSDLNIIWMGESSGDDLVYQIVIDNSNSMGWEAGKMENAKIAAKLLVDSAVEGKTSVGVIRFDSSAYVVQPLTQIDSQSTKNSIKAKIDTITSGGGTSIGLAAQTALDGLLAMGTTDDTKVVFLISDGMSGDNAMAPIPAYQHNKIPIFTFAYGSDADRTTLQNMSDATNGFFYFSPVSLSDITGVFNSAFQEVSESMGVSAHALVSINSESFSIPVDSMMSRFNLIATHSGNQGSAVVELYDVNNNLIEPYNIVVSGNQTQRQYVVENPTAGEWTLHFTSQTGALDFSYQASVVPSGGISYSLGLINLTGETVQYPQPIQLLANLSKELPITGVNVYAHIKDPDGTVSIIEMKDDGIAPDAIGNDGYYSAILDYNQNGIYEIFIMMDNSDGTAVFTTKGLVFSQTLDDIEEYEPIVENFSRTAYMQVTVEGLQADDHGNNAGTSTQLNTESVDVPGKIDYAGDLDMFSLDIPSGMDTLVVRVTDHALGMESRLRIFNSDGVTVIAEKTIAPASLGIDYVLVKIDVNEGDRLYAEVSHVNTTANTGTYNISAGTLLASEQRTFDLTNLAKLASYWLDDCGVFDWCNGADGSRDGKVDFLDFAILANSWPDSPAEFEPDMIWVFINDSGAGMKDKNGNPINQGGFAGEMNKYETTNAQYCYFLNNALASGDITVGSDNIVYGANGSNSGTDFVGEIYFRIYPASSYSQITYSAGVFNVRSRDGYDMGNHPVVMVSWYGATAFANYYGWRLPSEWQWQAVADYDGSYTYGCGTSIDQSKANYYAGEDANPLGLTSYPYTSPINHYPSYGYGMNDMAGNVLEWTSTVSGGSYRVFRGGSWATNSSSCTVAIRSSLSPFLTCYNVGFRVCR